MHLIEGDSILLMPKWRQTLEEIYRTSTRKNTAEQGALSVPSSHVEEPLRGIDNTEKRPDLIYLDPMFPARRKSGLIQKKLQLIQMLESPCVEEEALLNAAMALRPMKIIIKRPLKGENLAGKSPGYSIRGKTVRYDCIAIP
ncbi:MAG: class I SAM-dependent methyltransferase [Lachnospiraceae bacterium]|nr:class I SAM-dependent methyltransferase [Lachnospiraceae bacterium]